jgi:hypothetical protein
MDTIPWQGYVSFTNAKQTKIVMVWLTEKQNENQGDQISQNNISISN